MTEPAGFRCWMDVDLTALEANWRNLRRLIGPEMQVIASVKGNAYGHGILPVGRCLAAFGAAALATGSIADVRSLRQAGLDVPILSFAAPLPTELDEVLQLGAMPTLHCVEIAEAVSRIASREHPVHIKIDAGHGRLGLPLRDAVDSILEIARMPRLRIEGLYTHLPFSDVTGRDWAQERIHAFDRVVASLAAHGLRIPVIQSRASAAILCGLADSGNAVAPGGLLYGKLPIPAEMTDPAPWQPVLSAVRTRLIHINSRAADRTPGFTGRYADRVTGATGVATFGRADGHRPAQKGQQAYMLLRGHRVPVLGVSLEHAVLDLSGIPDPQIGEVVTVCGRDGDAAITLSDVAGWQGVTASDVLMTLDGRMARHILPTGEILPRQD